MPTSVCMKRPEGAESLLGQASRWEGGRGVGRRAGPGEVWRNDSEASLAAPPLEGWEHAIWAGWMPTSPARASTSSSNQVCDCPLLDKMLFHFAGQMAEGKHWL